MTGNCTDSYFRKVLGTAVLLCGLCGVARGQNVSGSASQQPSQPSSVEAVEKPILTLDQLKAAGARRTSYRKHKRPATETETPQPALDAFRKDVEPVLKKSCVQCHGSKTQEGNMRIDTLDPDLLHGADVDWWLEILAVLSNGEMPPADSDRLPDADRRRVVGWLSAEIQVASAVRRAEQGHSSFRRMARYEYRYALQDLLGLPYDFARDLPPDAISEDGFQNSSETLHMSAIQFGIFRDASRKALLRATVRGARPTPIYWSVSMQAAAAELWGKQDKELAEIRKQHKDDPEKLKQELERRIAKYRVRPHSAHYKDLNTGRAAQAQWSYGGAKYAWEPTQTRPDLQPASQHVAVIPPRQKLIVELGNRVPDQGILRVRVRASQTLSDARRPPSLQLEFGWQASNDSQASVRVSDHDLTIHSAPDKPQFYHWDVALGEIYPRNSVRKTGKMGQTPSPSEFVKLVNSSVSEGDIQIDYVEITAPVHEQWPPDSHRRIFMGSANKSDESARARDVLTRFMPRAWRRSVTPAEVDQKLALFTKIRPACDGFQAAMIEVLATVLSSPKFLYLVQAETPKRSENDTRVARLSDSELASRLSMFLWCSTPDETLRDLASKGRLNNRDVLVKQVKNMLDDARSRRFSRHFARQWLGLQLLDFLKVDQKTYREFDPALKEAMQMEPIAFFHEVLQADRSVLDFLHADYTMANERLAKHYGLSGVHGNDFRRVKLESQHRRGGLLTQAGLLAMNSDGKDSHPLKRGIWMLERLLNDPPPPPPPAVPEIDLADPEIAKLTLKQRIEQHRNHAACMSCHAKIDPWGIAFENFDAVGSWRTQIQGKPVDASSQLFNGQKLDGMDGLKRFLLENR
ncbi:MAG: DUF1592 domain-containing protein, partial [Planctomycetaceae bacterium]